MVRPGLGEPVTAPGPLAVLQWRLCSAASGRSCRSKYSARRVGPFSGLAARPGHTPSLLSCLLPTWLESMPCLERRAGQSSAAHLCWTAPPHRHRCCTTALARRSHHTGGRCTRAEQVWRLWSAPPHIPVPAQSVVCSPQLHCITLQSNDVKYEYEAKVAFKMIRKTFVCLVVDLTL